MKYLTFLFPILVICVGLLPTLFATVAFDKSVPPKERQKIQSYFDSVSGLIQKGQYVEAFNAISSPKVVFDNQVMRSTDTATSPEAFAALFDHYKALGQLTVTTISCTRPEKKKYEAHGTLKLASLARPFQVTTTLTVDKPFDSPGVKVTSAKFTIFA